MLQFLTNDIPEESPGDVAVTGRQGACQEHVGEPTALTPQRLLPGDPGWGGTFHHPSSPCNQQGSGGGTGLPLPCWAPRQLSMGE